jgi:hypothetical protein
MRGEVPLLYELPQHSLSDNRRLTIDQRPRRNERLHQLFGKLASHTLQKMPS